MSDKRRRINTVPSDGVFRGVSMSTTTCVGDCSSSLESWEMRDNDYPRFDPSASYTQNYGNGESKNDGTSNGTTQITTAGTRGR